MKDLSPEWESSAGEYRCKLVVEGICLIAVDCNWCIIYSQGRTKETVCILGRGEAVLILDGPTVAPLNVKTTLNVKNPITANVNK